MKKLIDMFRLLEGKKTYIVAFLVATVSFAVGMGWIDESTALLLYGFLGAGGLATLRAAVRQA